MIRIDTTFKWTPDYEKLFDVMIERIGADKILAIPDTRYPFLSKGISSVLVQEFREGKRLISITSRVNNKEKQKMSTTGTELCGIVSNLQTYKHNLIGSPHPVYTYTDHEALYYLWDRRCKLTQIFQIYMLFIFQFQNFNIIWTQEKI